MDAKQEDLAYADYVARQEAYNFIPLKKDQWVKLWWPAVKKNLNDRYKMGWKMPAWFIPESAK